MPAVIPDLEELKELVPYRSDAWVEKLQEKFNEIRAKRTYHNADDRELDRKLRNTTLITFSQLTDAAIEAGHPDFLLRVLKEDARITGLTTADVSIQIGAGSAESLPDLSHLSDEEIERMQRPAIETTATPMVEDGHKRRKSTRSRKNRGQADTDSDGRPEDS